MRFFAKNNDDWNNYNSGNHTGEGQSVLFVDGHVEFVRKPIVGVNNDNIYTIQGEQTGSDALKLTSSERYDVPGKQSSDTHRTRCPRRTRSSCRKSSDRYVFRILQGRLAVIGRRPVLLRLQAQK